MAKLTLSFFTFLFFFTCTINVVTAQKASIHDKINEDMYGKFSRAYETLDYDLFASIHSKEMIRVAGGNNGNIKNVTAYLEGYKKRWSDPKRRTAKISFRLFERILSDAIVSDRGIYKVTYTNDKNQLKNSYGQFHVLLKLEGKDWKITLDYDSNENKSIGKDNFDAAFALSDYKLYCKQ